MYSPARFIAISNYYDIYSVYDNYGILLTNILPALAHLCNNMNPLIDLSFIQGELLSDRSVGRAVSWAPWGLDLLSSIYI